METKYQKRDLAMTSLDAKICIFQMGVTGSFSVGSLRPITVMYRCLTRLGSIEGLHRAVAGCSESAAAVQGRRTFGWSCRAMQEQRRERRKNTDKDKLVVVRAEDKYNTVPPLERNKETFMAIIKLFKDHRGRNHVDFINVSRANMKDFGVHKDLDVYKALLQVFPEGTMVPANQWQRLFIHYPQQQFCCVRLLDEMEWHGVQPDKELHDIVASIFGQWNFATKKAKRMLYWMPKLKHANKYLDRRHVEDQNLSAAELAGIALKMMNRDPGAELSLVTLSDIDMEVKDHPAWICYSQSFVQRNLIKELPDNYEVFVDGPYRVYVMQTPVQYIVLSCKPLRECTRQDEFKKDQTFDDNYENWFSEWQERQRSRGRSCHEQQEETILALGALYSNDRQTGKRWVSELEKSNPKIAKLQVRIRLEEEEEKDNSNAQNS
ncbi:hypothetical protein WR25_26886 isoform A [Diploscapter pachys]|uniref:Evolutionarily conserved signaling intermediate in Toll pathway, mitochondrial n=1 Tax=Diploscapter pachys TaxID=2018661 RepID=A0A2A2J7I4_9BILA|nr:hypothetical protein WR25_26886 isoform A [Diploscapter pachys]